MKINIDRAISYHFKPNFTDFVNRMSNFNQKRYIKYNIYFSFASRFILLKSMLFPYFCRLIQSRYATRFPDA